MELPTPAATGTPMQNLGKALYNRIPVPPPRMGSPLRAVGGLTKSLPALSYRNPRSIKRKGKKRRKLCEKSEELKKVLASMLPYSALPIVKTSSTLSPERERERETYSNRMTATPHPRYGFERLHDAVQALLDNLSYNECDTLEDRWDTLGTWVDSFHISTDLEHNIQACKDMYQWCTTKECSDSDSLAGYFSLFEQLMLVCVRTVPSLKVIIRGVFSFIMDSVFLTKPTGNPELMLESVTEEVLSEVKERYSSVSLYKTSVNEVKREASNAVGRHSERSKKAATFVTGLTGVYRKSILRLTFGMWKNLTRKVVDPFSIPKSLSGTFIRSDTQTFITAENTSSVVHRDDKLKDDEIANLKQELSKMKQILNSTNSNVSGLEEVVNSQREEIKSLTQTISNLTRIAEEHDKSAVKISESQIEITQQSDKINQLNYIVQKACDKLVGGMHDQRERVTYWGDESVITNFSSENLRRWINYTTSLATNCPPCDVTSWDLGPHLMQPIGTVLHVLSPVMSDFGTNNFYKFTSETSNKVKAVMLLRALDGLGVSLDLTPEDLSTPAIDSSSSCVYFTIICILYYKYTTIVPECGIRLRSVAKMEPPKSPKGVAKLRIQFEDCASQSSIWHKTSTSALLEAISTLMASLLRKGKGRDSNDTRALNRDLHVEINPDLVAILDLSQDDNGESAIREVNDVLDTYSEDLRNIFTFYASSSSGGVGAKVMNEPEFWHFVRDTKIIAKGCTRNHLSNMIITIEDITLGSWASLLVRIANIKFKGSGAPARKLTKLLTQHILHNSKQMEMDTFRKSIYTEKVQGILTEFNSTVMNIFKQYSEHKSGVHSMTKSMYDRLLHDIHITDPVCTNYILDEIFKQIQDPEDPSEDLLFHEFWECIVTIAAVKRPEPYLPLYQRVKHFLESWLIPPFKTLKLGTDQPKRRVKRKSFMHR